MLGRRVFEVCSAELILAFDRTLINEHEPTVFPILLAATTSLSLPPPSLLPFLPPSRPPAFLPSLPPLLLALPLCQWWRHSPAPLPRTSIHRQIPACNTRGEKEGVEREGGKERARTATHNKCIATLKADAISRTDQVWIFLILIRFVSGAVKKNTLTPWP